MSRNPVLSDKAFDPASFGGTAVADAPSPAQEWDQAQGMQGVTAPAADAAMAAGTPTGPIVTTGRTMTLGGTASATFLFLAVAVLVGIYGWTQVTEVPIAFPEPGGPTVEASFDQPVLLFVALFVALGFAILTAFKPKLARFTGFAYAAAEGYVLGAISHFFESQWNGIVVQAILATSGVFLTMLALYGLRILRVTPRMTKGIIAATMGVFLLYMVGWIASIFGAEMDFMFGTGGGALGIVFSVVIVGIAAFNLLLDFDFIEKGVKNGLPAYMDWYGAFGLMVTLVWLYIEMLRLLARLRN